MSEKTFDGAWDNAEVSTAEHDELVLYLLDKKNARIIIDHLIEKFAPGKQKPYKYTFSMESECVVGNSRYIHGYIDVCYFIKLADQYGTRSIFFEVKPKVYNFGSLLRQINKYKIHDKDARWVVYTKDCPENIKSALEGQNISVLIHKV